MAIGQFYLPSRVESFFIDMFSLVGVVIASIVAFVCYKWYNRKHPVITDTEANLTEVCYV